MELRDLVVIGAALLAFTGATAALCRWLEKLAEPPVTKRLDEHERAIGGADPFGQ